MLKYGRRLSHVVVIQLYESLNSLMSKANSPLVTEFAHDTIQLLAKVVSYLYYFKF